MNRLDFQRLAKLRITDGRVLLSAGHFAGAYYLVGYAVESALKACIAKLIQPNTIPDKAFINAIYVHKLDSLLGTAGLRPVFDADAKADPELAAYWAIANNWSEESRYAFWDPFAAASMIQAVHEPNHGVFQWVKKHW